MKNPIRVLRLTAIAEGVSFLVLLFVAMPLKYFGGMPRAVTFTGWAHGVLFMMLCLALANVLAAARWPIGRAAVVFLAGLIPFGPFVLDRRMKQYEAAYQAGTAGD